MDAETLLAGIKKLLGVDPPAQEAVDLGAGKPIRLPTGIYGAFRGGDENGNVTITEPMLREAVKNFDMASRVPLKLGHEPISTSSPNLGAVSAVEYDAPSNSLVMTPNATEYGTFLAKTGGYTNASAELRRDPKKGWFLKALGLLGEWPPAVPASEPIALGAPGPAELILLARVSDEKPDLFLGITAEQRKDVPAQDFAGPNNTFPIRHAYDVTNAAMLLHHAKDPAAVKARIIEIAKRKGFALPESWGETKGSSEEGKGDATSGAEETAEMGASKPGSPERKESDMSDQDKALAEKAATDAKARIERLEKANIALAAQGVDSVMAAAIKKIPMKAKAACRELGIFLAGLTVTSPDAEILLAGAKGEEPKKLTPFDVWKGMIEAMPEQLEAHLAAPAADPAKALDGKKPDGPLPDNVRQFDLAAQYPKAKITKTDRHAAITAELGRRIAAGEKDLTYSEVSETIDMASVAGKDGQ